MADLKQSYNPRSQKWVLIDCSTKGGIKKMSDEKFDNVPIINGKNKEEPRENGTENNDAEMDPKIEKLDDPKDRQNDDWIF